MAKSLKYFVTVENPDGEHQTFGPDDDVPSWAAKKITNPSAWDDGEDDPDVVTPTPAVIPPVTTQTGDGDDQGDSGDGDQGGGSGEGDTKPYSEWKKADLEAEVTRRNEGRDAADHVDVAAPGNKAELAAALDADDEA